MGLPVAVCLGSAKSLDAMVWFCGGEGPGGEVAYVPGWFCLSESGRMESNR